MEISIRRSLGMSLIELITCLSVLSIVLAIAVPSAQGLILRNERVALTNGYFGLFAYARYRATSTRVITTICPLDESKTCTDNWDKPISVFPDANRDKQPDAGIIWRQLPPSSDNFHIYSRTGGRGYFRYDITGMTYGLSGSLVICPVEIENPFPTYIAVNRGGRLHRVEDEDHDGEITLSWGATVDC